jgi:hypothetical protein
MSSVPSSAPSKSIAFCAGMGVAYALLIALNLFNGMTLGESFVASRPLWFFPLVIVIAICYWLVERKKLSTHVGDTK